MKKLLFICLTLLATSLVLSLQAFTTHVKVDAPTVSFPLNYVAMGDSRAADPSGLNPWSTCARSSYSYPNVVASLLGAVKFQNVACVKAATQNFMFPQQFKYHTVPPQLNALTIGTDLVTISIGGNDIKWPTLVLPCFTYVFGADAHCRDNAVLNKQVTVRLMDLRTRFRAVLFAVHSRAPFAKVFVIGHGGYFGVHGCPVQVQISDQDLLWVHRFFTQFNQVLRDATVDGADYFIDVTLLAAGHDACAPSGVRWFAGREPVDSAPSLHPTPAGAVAIGQLVADFIRSMQDTPVLRVVAPPVASTKPVPVVTTLHGEPVVKSTLPRVTAIPSIPAR